jgi:GNAT superfamily N-acetyltransferase
MFDRSLTVRIERWSADTATRFASALAACDPSWGTDVRPIADGQLVLCGVGLYVNRGIALGLDTDLDDDDIEQIVERAAAVGVPPAAEVTPATTAGSRSTLSRHRFVPDGDSEVSVWAVELDRFDWSFSDLPTLERLVVVESSLAQWMEVSAEGWGHIAPDARHAADTFASVAHVTGDRLLLAVDSSDGRPIGCASLTIADGIANLGGMSTVPAERRRGVQSALIRHRLDLARAAGCELATSSARTGGASERNLARHGFTCTHVRETWVRQ